MRNGDGIFFFLYSLCRRSVQTLSTCSGLSRCCFTALKRTARCKKEMATSACCLLQWRRSSSPNCQVRGIACSEMSLACKPVENFSYYMHFSLLCVCGSVGRAGVGPTFQQSNNQVCELHSQTAKRLSHCAARGQPIHTGTPHPHHLFPQNTLAVRLPDIFRRTAVITLIPPPFFQELLKTIVLRTRRTLDEDVFLPLYPKKYVLINNNINIWIPLRIFSIFTIST